MVKHLPTMWGPRFDPWVGKNPGEGNGNPLQYSCLESPMDRGAWRATAYRVAKSRTRLKQLSMAQQHPSKIKTVSIFLNLTRDISKNPTPIILNVRNLMIRNRIDIPSPLLFNIILVVLDNYALCSHGWETKDAHIWQDK